jgi:hypothetical protein
MTLLCAYAILVLFHHPPGLIVLVDIPVVPVLLIQLLYVIYTML